MLLYEKLRQELVKKGEKFPLYFDYQATTPMDSRVLDAMIPYFTEKYGNPHSTSHKFGTEANEAVEIARRYVATLIRAQVNEIIFTSGATESNNIALKGIAYGAKKKHIIVTKIEHKCVLESCKFLEKIGFCVTYLPVQKNGILDLDILEKSITSETLLVSIMCINNEIGVIQPLKEIGKICKSKDIIFHSDIAQAFGKIPIDVNELNLDIASISGHKIYGPKGIGALYIRKEARRYLSPIISGGGQEKNIRSGTVPSPLVVGLGMAAKIAESEMESDLKNLKFLFDYFVNEIIRRVPDVYLNGDRYQRYPGNVNLSFAYVEGESLMLAIKDLAVSSGSACTSESLQPSYVLQALNISQSLAHTSIRFGFGKFTTKEQIDFAIELICNKINKLRDLSPLFEMVQEGVDIDKIKWK